MPTKRDLLRINRRREPKFKGYEKCPDCGYKIVDPRRRKCPECDLDFFPKPMRRRA